MTTGISGKHGSALDSLLALECTQCETKFRRSPVCDWQAEGVRNLCFDCFLIAALGVVCDRVIFARESNMIALGANIEPLRITARNEKTHEWYALTVTGRVVILPPNAAFERLSYGPETKSS